MSAPLYSLQSDPRLLRVQVVNTFIARHTPTNESRVWEDDKHWKGSVQSRQPALRPNVSRFSYVGGSRGVPVLVPVRASPVPSVVRGSSVVKFLCCKILMFLFSEIRRHLSPSRRGRRLQEGAMKLCLLIDDMEGLRDRREAECGAQTDDMEGLRDRREAECGARTSKNTFFPLHLVPLCLLVFMQGM